MNTPSLFIDKQFIVINSINESVCTVKYKIVQAFFFEENGIRFNFSGVDTTSIKGFNCISGNLLKILHNKSKTDLNSFTYNIKFLVEKNNHRKWFTFTKGILTEETSLKKHLWFTSEERNLEKPETKLSASDAQSLLATVVKKEITKINSGLRLAKKASAVRYQKCDVSDISTEMNFRVFNLYMTKIRGLSKQLKILECQAKVLKQISKNH